MLFLCYALQGLALEVSTFLLLQRFQLRVDQILSELRASSLYLTHATLWTRPFFFCHMLPTYGCGVLFLVCKQPSPAASSQDARRLRASRFYFLRIFFSFGFLVPGLPLFDTQFYCCEMLCFAVISQCRHPVGRTNALWATELWQS